MKVLIVDDDPNLRTLYAEALSRAGFEPTAVNDAASAMASLTEFAWPVVVLDLRLGRDHGLDVVREVERLGLPVRVVIVSGTAEFSREELFGVSPAISAVLRKPVDIEILVGEVRLLASLDQGVRSTE